jgi:signal transduction histidine kinase
VSPDAPAPRADPTAEGGISSARTPWAESGFWVLQLAVLALALVRLAVTVGFTLDAGNLILEVSTVAVFVVPVVFAALNYGLPGGLATVAWIAVLCIPRMVEASARPDRVVLWAELIQVAVLAAVAVLVGGKVSAESAARHQADLARSARFEAELLYQEMFESNRSPILIVDAEGRVVGSNPSADRAFRLPPDGTRHRDTGDTGDTGDTAGTGVGGVGGVGGDRTAQATAAPRRLIDVIGPDAAALVLTRLIAVGDPGAGAPSASDPGGRGGDGDPEERVPPVPVEIDGQRTLLRPTVTRVGRRGRDRRMQVIFEDVTAETRRHDLMEAFAGQVVLGQEEERRHLAQELHDGPLQALIHLCRQIDSLDPDRGPSGTAGAPFVAMRTTVEETIAELRSIARGLRPSVLDDLGLVASINQVLAEASDRQGFDGRFEVAGTERRLPAAAELALFRIAQEAITNVEHHARAAQVTVTVEFGDSGLRLRVEDDGSGFDRSRRNREHGGPSLGLTGMTERARLIGARLRVDSLVGKGTVVEAWLPSDVSGA